MPHARRLLVGIAVGTVAMVAAFATSSTADDKCGGAEGVSVRKDGECCDFSINCAPGSICNDPAVDLFDPAKPKMTCIRVECTSDAECSAPKVCTLARTCSPPQCRSDRDCSTGRCIGGTCARPPDPQLAVGCTVLTQHETLVSGQKAVLAAVAIDAQGRVVGGMDFDFASSEQEVVAISSTIATVGTTAGTADLRASVAGNPNVVCDGPSIAGFAPASAGTARVIAVEEKSRRPIEGARVVLDAGGTRTATTDVAGVASFPMPAAAIDAVTVARSGFASVSVLSPGTSDLLVPLPRALDAGVTGGFRGNVDLSSARAADLHLALVGRPLPANLLDVRRADVFGEPQPTFTRPGSALPWVICTSQGGFDFKIGCACSSVPPSSTCPNGLVPGGYLLGIGADSIADDHTADFGGTRCQGEAPPPQALGCAAVSAPPEPTIAWSLEAELRISNVTAYATTRSDYWLPKAPVAPIEGLVVLGGFRLAQRHALSPPFDVAGEPHRYTPKDVAGYRRIFLAADTPASLYGVVRLPDLPRLENGACPDQALLIVSAAVPGRGLVPLGVSSRSAGADCRIAGDPHPLGDMALPAADGFMAIAVAPRHGGLEGLPLVMTAFAFEGQPDHGSRITAVVARRDALEEREDLHDRMFISYPAATIARDPPRVTFEGPTPGATFLRIDVESPTARWLVYAPADRGDLVLPSDPASRAILSAATRSAIAAARIEGTFAELWTLSSERRIDRLAAQLIAFAEEECESRAACKLR